VRVAGLRVIAGLFSIAGLCSALGLTEFEAVDFLEPEEDVEGVPFFDQATSPRGSYTRTH
jgi:hypothetical protein